MNTSTSPVPESAAPDGPRWRAYPLAADGLAHHAAGWDRLNAAQFGSHPLLDSRYWNWHLKRSGAAGVVLWSLEVEHSQPAALCLLVYSGGGRWVSYGPPGASLGPVLIASRRMVDQLLRGLQPKAVQLDLLGIDPEVCDISPEPWQEAEVRCHAWAVKLALRPQAAALRAGAWPGRHASAGPGSARETMSSEAGSAPGSAELRVATDVADVASALQRLPAMGPADRTAADEEALATSFASTGQAAVLQWWVADKLVESRLCLLSADRAVMLDAPPRGAGVVDAQEQRRRFAQAGHWVRSSRGASIVEVHPSELREPEAACGDSHHIRNLSFHTGGLAQTAGRWFSRLQSVLGANAAVERAVGYTVEQLPMAAPWPDDVAGFLDSAAAATPQATSDWMRNLRQTVYGKHPGTYLCVLRQGDAVVAVLPIVIDRAMAGNVLTLLSNYYTALFVPAWAPGLTAQGLAVALRGLLHHNRPLAEMRLEPMDPHADHFHLLQQALGLAGMVTHRYYRFGNWYLPTAGSYADFLKERTAGLRSTIKRMGKRCSEAGGAIEILTQESDLARGLQAYWQVYRTSWKVDEPFPEFINGLAAWCAKQGKLRLGILSLQGQPVAAQIWLVHGGRAEIFKVAYDEAHKAVSPGSVLTAALMEWVIDQDKVSEVDFLMGDDAYKRTWMSHRRERWGLVAFNVRRLRGAAGLVRLLAGRLARNLKSKRLVSPAQEQAEAP